MSRTALAFMSYVNLDDQHEQGRLTRFRECLSGEVRMQTGEPFDIFQDRKDIAWGQQWQERINQSLDAVTFLIPIITPAFFKSAACREELERFLKREEELKRGDLILPVYYVNCLILRDQAKRDHDPLAQILAARQYADWRELRFEDFTSSQHRKALAKMAEQIVAALERSQKESARQRYKKESKKAASQNNTFQSKGGTQSVAQGKGAIGTQINNYGPQVLPSDQAKPKPLVRKSIVAIAFMCVALLLAIYYATQSKKMAPDLPIRVELKNGSDSQTKPAGQDAPSAIVETSVAISSVNSDYTDSSNDKDIISKLFHRSYAVVIGISKYRNSGTWKTLNNAENDAQAMNDFLIGQGFKVQRFVGQQATMRNIISYLEDTLAPQLTQNDRFVFYFSGHGSTRSLGGSDRGYLIPYDGDTEKSSTWIAMEQLKGLADKLGNARHQLFILDSCFGGLFATKGALSTAPEGIPHYIKEITSSRARQYLTAGGANQETPARSNLSGYREHSYYTAYLLKGLREGAADTHPDGFITASELSAYLEPAATTAYNTPRGGHFPGHEQGDFVFRSPKPARIKMNDPVPAGPTKGNKKKSIGGSNRPPVSQPYLKEVRQDKTHRRKNRMIAVHPQYVVDAAQTRTAVLIPAAEWEQILEELDDIRAYDAAKAGPQDVPFAQALRETP